MTSRGRVRGTRFELGGEELFVLSVETGVNKRPSALTEAEWEVCRLALDGLTNTNIATARGTATRTVANQLASVYQKLGVTSRAELAALLRRGVP